MASGELDRLMMLYSLGLLRKDEHTRLVDGLKDLPRGEMQAFAAVQDAAAAVAELTALVPPQGAKEALLRRARESAASTHDLPGFSFVRASDPWTPYTGAPGISLKMLATDQRSGTVTLLARLEARTAFPPHDHSGPEQTFVLSGDLTSGGRRLGAGDFFFAEAGSHHPDVYSEGGCTALLVLSLEDFARIHGASAAPADA